MMMMTIVFSAYCVTTLQKPSSEFAHLLRPYITLNTATLMRNIAAFCYPVNGSRTLQKMGGKYKICMTLKRIWDVLLLGPI